MATEATWPPGRGRGPVAGPRILAGARPACTGGQIRARGLGPGPGPGITLHNNENLMPPRLVTFHFLFSFLGSGPRPRAPGFGPRVLGSGRPQTPSAGNENVMPPSWPGQGRRPSNENVMEASWKCFVSDDVPGPGPGAWAPGLAPRAPGPGPGFGPPGPGPGLRALGPGPGLRAGLEIVLPRAPGPAPGPRARAPPPGPGAPGPGPHA